MIAISPFLVWFICVDNTMSSDTLSLTLTAKIIVDNRSDQDAKGYIHRLSIPVSGHMQQKLTGIRYDDRGVVKRKWHNSGDSEYLEFHWDIPAKSTFTRIVNFDLLVHGYDYRLEKEKVSLKKPGKFLLASQFIESDSSDIRSMASEIRRKYSTDEAKLREAFLIPQNILKYHVQPTKGALSAVKTRRGDCTEFSTLFVALARAMGYPARVTTDFLFTSATSFFQPNHHSSEVYFNGKWVPVDPNLALNSEFGYAFGIGKDRKVILTRGFNWVWSNLWPGEFRNFSELTDINIHWKINER